MKLFTRQRHGVEPTDFGYLFLKQAALVVAQLADLEREVALAKGLQKGELTVGFGPYTAELLVPNCLRRFTSAHPSIRLRIQVDSVENLARNLRTRQTDVIVVEASLFEEDETLEIIARLPPIVGYLMVRSGHPLTSQPNASIANALDYPFVQVVRLPPRVLKPILAARRTLKDRLDKPVPPFPAIECPTVPLAISAIVNSNAVMMATLGMVQSEMKAGRVVPVLREPWMHANWGIVRLRSRSLAPAATAFLDEILRAHAAALSEDAILRNRWAARFSQKGEAKSPKARSAR